MDGNNNHFPIRPCLCGSITHRSKISKLCIYYVPSNGSQDIINTNSTENNQPTKDEEEIQKYLDSRKLSTTEPFWRIFAFV